MKLLTFLLLISITAAAQKHMVLMQTLPPVSRTCLCGSQNDKHMDSVIFSSGQLVKWENWPADTIPARRSPDSIRRQGNPDLIKKNSKTKNLKRPVDYWLSAGLYDTVPVSIVAADGKVSKGFAVYEQGTNIAGKPQPKLVTYLDSRKRKIVSKPKAVRWGR